jgi:hypothetical protein
MHANPLHLLLVISLFALDVEMLMRAPRGGGGE